MKQRILRMLALLFVITGFFLISSKAHSQFIFSVKELNTFSEKAIFRSDFSDIVNYFKEHGFYRMENSDNFQDKYGNKITILTVRQVPEFFSLTYYIRKPNAEVLKRLKEELKNYYSFENQSGKIGYIIDEKCIINVENKPGVEFVLSFYVNSKGGSFIPAKRIDESHLEVSSYRHGTNIKVKQGDKIYLKATGSIVLGPWLGSGGPDGIDGFQNYSKESEFKHGALLCYIDDNKTYGKPFVKVGSFCSFTATRSGDLRFVINDNDPGNNRGSFIVEYSINKEITPSATSAKPELAESRISTSNNTAERKNDVKAININENSLQINSYTNSTDIAIEKGEQVIIAAKGQIVFGGSAGAGGPDGINGYTGYNRIRGFRHGCLLVRVGDKGEWEAVGVSKTIVAASNGVLQFIVNDADPSNNTGSFIADITIITSQGELKKLNR